MRKLLVAALLATLAPATAHAFCGFYINGAGGDMFNNATQVVLMRAGTRTVLAMQNNYQGPPSDFAMVVPVPVVLHEGDVKTLPKDVFDRVDVMGSPRLVEYWEKDPCAPDDVSYPYAPPLPSPVVEEEDASSSAGRHGVKIEAQFTVGEYQIVILSAADSTGLDAYLREQHYQIPAGAEPLLRPYVAAGMKFFVAKVDPKKVTFVNGQAQLSPLRFHYDSEEFSLPIRLGLANSSGTQDLIVNIIAEKQRYEVANYPNVTIPTNFDVKDAVRTRFGEFYAALFDRTVAQHPGAVVTEYSWIAESCDPCPGPTLTPTDFATLGADVLGIDANAMYELTLTRLHARYGKDGAPNDLVFRAAPPIVGGREMRDDHGVLEHGAKPDALNNFQARYAIRHAWEKPIACANPKRGRWGGPWNDAQIANGGAPQAATNLAFVPRGQIALPDVVAQDVPELGVHATAAGPLPGGASFATKPQGCGCQTQTSDESGWALAGLVGLALRRKKKVTV
jgi:MYXO-CTERM domain-containing protein